MSRPRRGEPVQKDVVFSLLPAAIAHTSGNGQYGFNLRNLYYSVRPGFSEVFSKELTYSTFSDVITDYEGSHGDIKGMFRDDRGYLYVPHSDVEIPLGTKSVRAYERPEWTFNKIIYVEKGGIVSLLRQAGWPERNDCALLHSQGYASRAVRDLFDQLGETDEELTFFCVHDADGPGTCIYQALVEATKARPGRKVKVINLGLDPAEAVAMGLAIEPVEAKRKVPAADYVEPEWVEWLQTSRIELNAMTSPQFIAWLDSKVAVHDTGKVVPPFEVMIERLQSEVHSTIRSRAIEVVEERLDFDTLVQAEMANMLGQVDYETVDLGESVSEFLDENPEDRWTDAVDAAAEMLCEAVAA